MTSDPTGTIAAFHDRCEALTGDRWCPYPSAAFILAIMTADDDVARKLITRRRTFTFPAFLAGEPMENEIREVLGATE